MNSHKERRKLAAVPLIAVMMTSAGCDFTDGEYDVIIRTDRDLYEWRGEESESHLILSVENIGDRTVYFHCGFGFGIEMSVNGSVVQPAALAYHQCTAAYALEPGQKWERRERVPSRRGVADPDATVRYRYRVLLLKDEAAANTEPWTVRYRDGKGEIDLEMQMSNSFEVIRVSE